MYSASKNFAEKFSELHQELSNCKSELVMVHLEIGKSRRLNRNVPVKLEREEKALEKKIDELESELKKLKADPNDPDDSI